MGNNSRKWRFIPTGVGNTELDERYYTVKTVHPHGCGEHEPIPFDPLLVAGSSPRVWGTHHEHHAQAASERFIPTGVGNTEMGHLSDQETPVHPHGCGEHTPMQILRSSQVGSSPRVWGTRTGQAQCCI